MSLIDMDQVLTNLDGKPIKEFNERGEPSDKSMTLGNAISFAMIAMVPSVDQTVSAEEKYKRFLLGSKCLHGSVALTAEEISYIKARVGHTHSVVAVGRIWEFLDPPVKEKLN